MPSHLELGLYLLLAVGGGGGLLGFAGVLGRTRRWRLFTGLFALALIGCAAAVTALGFPVQMWLPLVVLAAAWGCLWVARSLWLARAGQFLLALCSEPRVQGAALLLLCPLLPLWWASQFEETATDLDELAVHEAHGPPVLYQITTAQAVTDAGRPVPLFNSPEGEAAQETLAYESNMMRNRGLLEHLLRTAPPDPGYNCHGWVFAAGKFWLKGEEVQRILDDNGYHEESSPEQNDIAVFRDHAGQIVHTGLVRAVTDDGLVLIESKWGSLGRYIHTPLDQAYQATCSYYRSARHGHSLAGITGETPPLTPAVTADTAE